MAKDHAPAPDLPTLAADRAPGPAAGQPPVPWAARGLTYIIGTVLGAIAAMVAAVAGLGGGWLLLGIGALMAAGLWCGPIRPFRVRLRWWRAVKSIGFRRVGLFPLRGALRVAPAPTIQVRLIRPRSRYPVLQIALADATLHIPPELSVVRQLHPPDLLDRLLSAITQPSPAPPPLHQGDPSFDERREVGGEEALAASLLDERSRALIARLEPLDVWVIGGAVHLALIHTPPRTRPVDLGGWAMEATELAARLGRSAHPDAIRRRLADRAAEDRHLAARLHAARALWALDASSQEAACARRAFFEDRDPTARLEGALACGPPGAPVLLALIEGGLLTPEEVARAVPAWAALVPTAEREDNLTRWICAGAGPRRAPALRACAEQGVCPAPALLEAALEGAESTTAAAPLFGASASWATWLPRAFEAHAHVPATQAALIGVWSELAGPELAPRLASLCGEGQPELLADAARAGIARIVARFPGRVEGGGLALADEAAVAGALSEVAPPTDGP